MYINLLKTDIKMPKTLKLELEVHGLAAYTSPVYGMQQVP
jgi:hypothetical protein